jgi:hypothetical protein
MPKDHLFSTTSLGVNQTDESARSFEKGYIARLTIPTDPIGATRRQVLEHSARTAVTAAASMLAARVLKLPQNLLGANHNYGDHAVISWRNARSVLATLYRNSSWSSAWRVGGKSFRDVYTRIRRQRFPVGTILRRTANGSKRVSVRGRYAGNRFARSASGACVASCLSSIRRSIDRNRSGAGDDRSVAREGRHNKQATGQRDP